MESVVLGIYLWFKIYSLIDINAKIWTEIIDLVVLGRNYWSSCRVKIQYSFIRTTKKKKWNGIHMPYETLSLIGVTFEDEFQKYLRLKGKKQGEIVQVNDNQMMVLAKGHNLNVNAFQSNVNRPLSNSSRFLVNKFGVGWSVVQWDSSWISNMSGAGQGPGPRLCTREQGPIRGCRHLGSVQRPPVKRMTDTHDWKHYLRATS